MLAAVRVRGPAGRPRTRPGAVAGDKTPHAAIKSSGSYERGLRGLAEGDPFVGLLTVGQAVVELAEHAVEQRDLTRCD